MAGHKGHEYVWVKNVEHQLRHEADSDELRSVAEESAEGLREHHLWQKSRKPGHALSVINYPYASAGFSLNRPGSRRPQRYPATAF